MKLSTSGLKLLMGVLPSFLQRFIRYAELNPTHAAVVSDGRTVSYGQLLSDARRIAHRLAEIHPNARVLIHLPPGSDAFAAMFGSAMAGAVYAPLDVEAPPGRHRLFAYSFEPDIVVTKTTTTGAARRLASDAAIASVDALGHDELRELLPANDLVYVMFTSGSTGQPKGVMVAFDALSHYVNWALDAMQVRPADRWSLHPNIAFDLSVLDIFGALCGGATLYPITDAADRLLPAKAIQRHALTIWDSVPSVMSSMVRIGQVTPRNLETVRLFTFCGEPLLPMHVEAIFAARPDAIVHNTYGPTEATVSCTLNRLTRETWRATCGDTVAIGDAIPGMDVRIRNNGVDADEGEIVIAGPQVAHGYWRSPSLTERAFRPVSGAGEGGLAYHTGDWARRGSGGTFFVGRMDFQVKIRGERVELGDIAAAIQLCDRCVASVVLVEQQLHAFVEGADVNVATIRERLTSQLPRHLIPVRIHHVEELPRNLNNKVDHRRIQDMAAALATG